MSKLDGNERWQSKMLLTEHQEQYERRDAPKPAAVPPTAEELALIRDYVLLPHMLTMVEKGISDMNSSSGILKRLYLAAARMLLARISRDMYAVKRELARRSIRVIRDEQVDLVPYYRFICKGYEGRFGLVRDEVRGEISTRLARYIRELADWMNGHTPQSGAGSGGGDGAGHKNTRQPHDGRTTG
jgi:hypothetical protein